MVGGHVCEDVVVQVVRGLVGLHWKAVDAGQDNLRSRALLSIPCFSMEIHACARKTMTKLLYGVCIFLIFLLIVRTWWL